VKFSFIHARNALFPVATLCHRLGVSRSGYDAWAKRPKSERKKSDRALSVEVLQPDSVEVKEGTRRCRPHRPRGGDSNLAAHINRASG